MKKFVLLFLGLVLMTSCYDDSELWNSISDHDERIDKLEWICSQMNTNISSLQEIVDALQEKDFVVSTSPIVEDGEEIGYTIKFTSGKSITIYHGISPIIGVRLLGDGKYYWTVNGEWVRDASGNKIPATGQPGKDAIAPKLKIVDDYWYISYDAGSTWNRLGIAVGEDGEDGEDGADGDNFFKSVVETDESVIMTLADGTEIVIPKAKKVDIIFENVEGSVGVLPGEVRSISYTVKNGSENCLVKAFGQNGWSAKVKPESPSKGSIIITAPDEMTDDEVIVLVYDGESTTIMKTISFEEGLIVCDVTSLYVKGGGETIIVDVLSNLAMTVSTSATWINCTLKPSTKSLIPYSLEITAQKNYSGAERAATITVSDQSGKMVHTVALVQKEYDAYENFVDLSSGGETANCYIINKAGQYKFPIIKGNGSKGLIISGDTAELPNATGAKVVWQENDMITAVGINKGYVVFETGNTWKKGNAVLAVTDDTGTILWSWHIWSTDYVLGSGDITVYNHSKSRSYKMMSHTLGEVGSTALFYQFGRKDPFPKSGIEVVSSRGTLANSIKNPDVFYANSGGDWCSESRKDWWDSGYKSYNYSSTLASVISGNKTIYDPCPVGYRVPPDDAFTSFTKSGQNTESESDINSPDPGMYSFYMNDNTYYFYTQNGSSTIRFKAFGGLNAATAGYLTNIAYYYAAHPSYSSTSRLLQFYAGAVLPMNVDYSRALAGTIRPIRDDVQYEDVYESTDYSKDGSTITIQKHTVGNGIKILVVGDGFTDADINSGKYDQSMEKAVEYFFDIEPYKTFKNRFDVINMRVVSETSVFDEAKRTAFETTFGSGTHIQGNLSEAYQRSYDAFGTINDVLVIVVLNTKRYAGTCYMAGNTISVAFCPMSEETYYPFDTVVHHEAGGHGFANLGDEYYYGGTISQTEKDEIESWHQSYGWYENIDVVSDRTEVNWADFLTDPLYSSSVGVYEGAYSYSYGVWRPTYDSCMNHMYGTFNAPSRYAIYKRIMERSGESWSWDSFVEYDKINRDQDATAANARPITPPEDLPAHTPPVFVSPDTLPY